MAKVWKKEGESFESLLKRFNRRCSNENTLKDFKNKEFYKTPKERKKERALNTKKLKKRGK